jgi:glucan 1,3-beta-glucosidase
MIFLFLFFILIRKNIGQHVFSSNLIDFEIDNLGMTCLNDPHYNPFNQQIRGVNLGGWMVLEPWITPSLFYQFLGKEKTTTAMDTYTFCQVLGPIEANRQLRIHWDTWLTEDYISKLADLNINSLRLPLGDWMFTPYGPYIGCTNGALEKVDWLLQVADKYNLKVLLDLHGVIGSQNGFDNSGRASQVVWTSGENTDYIGAATFQHWSTRDAQWIGKFNFSNLKYDHINEDNIEMTLGVISKIVSRYQSFSSVMGLEPLNEPWQYTPINILKRYYWEGYKIIKNNTLTKNWKYIMHDSFRFDVSTWGGFMSNCPDIALDTHIYQAWQEPSNAQQFFLQACQISTQLVEMERSFGPVLVGEWSLGTDNCPLWLNGFNDNLPGFPKLNCQFKACPLSYLLNYKNKQGLEFARTPDPIKSIQPPYGTGISSPSFGMCPTDISWVDWPSSKNISVGPLPITSPLVDKYTLSVDHAVVRELAHKKIATFSRSTHGWFFWNFRTEISLRWDFLRAVEQGWIPSDIRQLNPDLASSCLKEDQGFYFCYAKRNIFEETIKAGLYWIENTQGVSNNNLTWIESLHGDNLITKADSIFNNYWHQNYIHGVSCDFGGAAELIEIPIQNHTNNNNQSYPKKVIYKYQVKNLLILAILFVTILIIFWGTFLFCILRLRCLQYFRDPYFYDNPAQMSPLHKDKRDYMTV